MGAAAGEYEGKVGPMEPYYILMKLPGSEQLEYLIISLLRRTTGTT